MQVTFGNGVPTAAEAESSLGMISGFPVASSFVIVCNIVTS
jgi:hypothetical protein